MYSDRFRRLWNRSDFRDSRLGEKHPWGLDIKFTSILKDLVHWIVSVLFSLIYSVLMSQRHAGHWSSIPVSVPSRNFWQREMTIRPCTHLPRQKVMRLCCWKYHYKASGLHSGLTAPSNSAACQLACLACLLKKKRTKTIRIRDRETAREAPHAETNEHASAFILRVISHPKRFKTPLWVCSSNERVPLRSGGEMFLAGKCEWSSL